MPAIRCLSQEKQDSKILIYKPKKPFGVNGFFYFG